MDKQLSVLLDSRCDIIKVNNFNGGINYEKGKY